MHEKISPKQSTVIFAALILILVSNVFGQNEVTEAVTKLKRIKVMESTREEVEKLFGAPKIEQARKGGGSQTIDYNLGFARLSVSYSLGKCSEHSKAIYNVDNNVVIRVYLFFLENVKAAKFKRELNGFREYKIFDANVREYSNDELGIQYSIGGKKIINSIELYPVDKHDYLYCQNDSK